MSLFGWLSENKWKPAVVAPERSPKLRYWQEKDLWFFELVDQHGAQLMRSSRGYSVLSETLDDIALCRDYMRDAEQIWWNPKP